MRNRMAVAGVAIIAAMFLLAFVGPRFAKYGWDELDFESLLHIIINNLMKGFCMGSLW